MKAKVRNKVFGSVWAGASWSSDAHTVWKVMMTIAFTAVRGLVTEQIRRPR